MPRLHKVLIVAHSDRSMQPAYEIISCLRDFGYSSDICHANSEDTPSKIKAVQVLDGSMGLSSYEGVIFLDDGGDAEAAVSLAEKATEQELVLGGHGEGFLVLSEAGALKDHYVCHGFDEDHYEDTKAVQVPSVRDDKVVTSTDDCATGFAILVADALGGKIKHIVRGKSGALPQRSALIVAPISKWSDFWHLAEEMKKRGSDIVLSDWDDIDTESRRMSCCALLDVDNNDVRLLSNQPLPRSVWFRDSSLTPEGTASAIARLESAGCENVNSSVTVRRLADKNIVHLLSDINNRDADVFDSSSIEQAVEKLASPGTWSVSSAPGAIRKTSMRVRGGNGPAIVSSQKASGRKHFVANKKSLKTSLASSFNRGEFVVRKAGSGPKLGNERFELTWVTRRTPDGWKVSSRIAKSARMTCCANEVIRLVFPDEWEPVLQDADMLAELVSVVLQSIMEQPDAMSELGMTMLLDGPAPFVGDVSPVVDLSAESEAKLGGIKLKKLAQSLCIPHDGTQPDPQEGTELADALDVRADDPVHRKVVERELAAEGIWLQPGGAIAMQTCDDISKLSGFEDLISRLRQEAIEAVEEEIEKVDDNDEVAAKLASIASRRARHRLRMAMEMEHLSHGAKNRVKLAGVYPSSVAGPFAHLELPMHERVFEWREGDDWLTDRERAISDLPRYNPEYDKSKMGDPAGFYFVWDDQNRSPTEWLNMLKGDTIYKTRNLLNPGKMY